jgi:hypothetical protein
MDRKADKLDANGKAGGDALGGKADTLRSGVTALRSDGSAATGGYMANAVDQAAYESMGGSVDGAAMVDPNNRTVDVSPDLISAITNAVLEEVAEWQNRPLDACYAVVFFDAIRVKVRHEGFVRNKAVYIALGIFPDGTREVLGLWIEQTEGAKFWLRVMNELKTRGLGDILIAVVDGLKGFPDAIMAVFP